ncbi:MAG: hypothetical protein LBK13_12045 [Spirochaetales bacterium]|jgi:hypothetical protein|nr:hypothetical protein [Spirochaetales bacterium]
MSQETCVHASVHSVHIETFKRANFFPGLQAGPAYWNSIEDYRFAKERLYNQLFHGFGVVPGYLDSLQVQAEKTKGGLLTLLVSPGLAIDGEGRPLFLYEPQALVLDIKKFKPPCRVYLLIRYEEKPDEFSRNTENPDLEGYRKRLETARLAIACEIREPELEIELARIQLEEEQDGLVSGIRNTEDFCDPGPNSLDYRFVPWAARVKRGVSVYLEKFLTEVLEQSRSLGASGFEALPLASLRGMQTTALTAKMIIQSCGVFFDDIIHLLKPLFDLDHQILFEIAEYERDHEEAGRLWTTKNSYELSRTAMYDFGERLKTYSGAYGELHQLLRAHEAVMKGLRQILITKEVSGEDIRYLSYAMPHILLFEEERYTLVDSVDLGSAESLESHQVEFVDTSHPGTSNEAFFYPDGTLVRDTVKRWVGGAMRLRLRNLIKGRRLLIIRRTDIYRGSYSVELTLDGKVLRVLSVDTADTRRRWRNLFAVFEETDIGANSCELNFSIGEKGRDNSGSLWAYQVL